MSSIFSYDNKFWQGVTKLVNVCYISVLWVIWCVPIVTAGASTTAMYYTVNKVLRHNRSYVFTEFWGAFKRNFKQSTIAWLILLVAALVLGADSIIMKAFYEAGSDIGKFYVAFYMMLLLEAVWAVYIFANIARFENTTKQIFKNAVLMAIGHFPWSLLMLLLFAVTLLLIALLPVLIFVLPSVFMLLCNLILEKIFRRYMSEESLREEEERNGVYYKK